MANAFAVQLPVVPEPPRPWRTWRGALPESFPLAGSDIDKQAQQLCDDLSQRDAHVEAVKQGRRDAEQAVQIAQRAYDLEVERAGAAGEVSNADAALLAKRDASVEAARPEIHNERLRIAVELRDQAEREYLRFVDSHALELVAELRQDAEDVAAEWREITAEFNRRLEPVVAEHARVRDAVRFILGNTPPFTHEDVSAACSEPPYPAPDAFARHHALHNPEPEPDPDNGPEDGLGVVFVETGAA